MPGGRRLGSTASNTQGSVIQNLAVHTALNSAALKQSIKDAKQPLNIFTTTPKNLTRFVARVGPMVAVQDEVIEIMTWQNPPKTFAWLLCYIFVCLYPILFTVVPQIALTYHILRNYYDRTKRDVVRKPRASTNMQYLKNMQFIQNFMGQFADLHDTAREKSKILDWSDEEETVRILKLVVISMFGVIFLVRLVPVNYIMLVVGVAAFLQNTALFRAASTTLPPVLMKNLQENIDTIRDAIAAASRGQSGSTVTVSLFENQRWWAGLGWVPHLLRSERGPWSDESGQIARAPKDLYELPGADWEWINPDWELNTKWATVDEEGWVYTDHNWQSAKDKSTMGSLTRRRMWVRTMKLKPKSAEAKAAKAD
ncbi:peroxisome- protein [Quaeritorhiza haematococci]|nr:peroxisome- protein [Quaeritorhiza haematococci]